MDINSSFCKMNRPDCYGARELDVLLELSFLLSNKDIDLDEVIRILAEHLSAERILLTILNRENQIIRIEGAFGIRPQEKETVVYRIGEGIIGKVIQDGETVLIPKIAASKDFLNLTQAPLRINGMDVSFICTPIRYKDEIIGTLSVHKIVGSMIGRTMRRRQEYAEELEQLRSENLSLKGELRNRINPEQIIGNSGK